MVEIFIFLCFLLFQTQRFSCEGEGFFRKVFPNIVHIVLVKLGDDSKTINKTHGTSIKY